MNNNLVKFATLQKNPFTSPVDKFWIKDTNAVFLSVSYMQTSCVVFLQRRLTWFLIGLYK